MLPALNKKEIVVLIKEHAQIIIPIRVGGLGIGTQAYSEVSCGSA